MPEDTPPLGRFVGRTHRLPVRIYYEDTDFTGVVYHANYLRFFERGRSDFVRAVGVAHQALLAQPEPLAFTVIALSVRYLKPARVDDAVMVETLFNTVQGPRLFISQSLQRGAETLCVAEVEACCIALNGRPKRPPAALLQALGPYLRAE